jgi:hypothetical protein
MRRQQTDHKCSGCFPQVLSTGADEGHSAKLYANVLTSSNDGTWLIEHSCVCFSDISQITEHPSAHELGKHYFCNDTRGFIHFNAIITLDSITQSDLGYEYHRHSCRCHRPDSRCHRSLGGRLLLLPPPEAVPTHRTRG